MNLKQKATVLLSFILFCAFTGGVMAFKAKRGAAIRCSTTTTLVGEIVVGYTVTTFGVGFKAYCTIDVLPITKTTRVTSQL